MIPWRMIHNSLFIDIKYISVVSFRLRNFKSKGGNVYNFSCPICGDSKKIKYKARCYFLLKNNVYRVWCHNCNYSSRFSSFLKTYFPDIYKDYIMDIFNEKNDDNHNSGSINSNIPPPISSSDARLIDKILSRCDKLDDEHICIKYLIERKIPKDKWKYLYYIDDMSLIGKLSEKYKDKFTKKEDRLLIPFYDFNGKLIAISCRDIRGTSSLKYITANISNDTIPFYGMDRVDINKLVYVVEGPLDSLFLDNCVAAATSDLSKVSKVIYKDKLVLIPDNQNRNKDIAKLYRRFCQNGFKVFVWPDNYPYKDINEMVQNGFDIDKLKEFVDSNVLTGLDLKLRLTKWLKV